MANAARPTRLHAEESSQMLANHLAKFSRGLTRSEIVNTLDLGSVHETTIWRWLDAAKQQGLVIMDGNTSSARWVASAELRRENARGHINRPLSKRPMCTYNEMWLKDYIPNESQYLPKRDLEKLVRRSPIGSAPISKFSAHDLSMFLCGLPFASSALEGNSYSLLDTVDLIEKQIEKNNANPTEAKMILNHHEAVQYLLRNISYPPTKDDVRLNGMEIRRLHNLLSHGLLKNPENAGKIRKESVTILESSYKPLDMQESIAGCMAHLVDTAAKIENPYEQAFFLIVHLSYLQPFTDCNKRTARVACNIPLLRAGVVPMAWMGVEIQPLREALLGVYELNDTSILSEIFVDGYMRSIEHFNIMKQSREPDEVSIKYHREIRQAVQNQVLHNLEIIPNSVDPLDKSQFVIGVNSELQLLRSGDEGALIRHRLREGDVQIWLMNEGQEKFQSRERLANSNHMG